MNTGDLSFRRKAALTLCAGMLLQFASWAQCENSLATRTYDTALTSTGFAIYNLSFPQWPLDSGLLVSVKITAEVSSQYQFTLRNADTAATYVLTVGQQDLVQRNSNTTPYSNLYTQQIGTYPLISGQAVSAGPFAFLDKHLSSDSITAGNTIDFLGNGQVNMTYESFTYTNLSSVNNTSYYYSTGITNTLHFSVQYLYCTNVGSTILATDLTRWQATADGPRTVLLAWSATNETAGELYEIQRSRDGQNFTAVTTMSAAVNGLTADYTYTDHVPGDPAGNWYYRLQMTNGVKVSYSDIRQVTLSGVNSTTDVNSNNTSTNKLRVYPNPAVDHIDLAPLTGSWSVEIYSASGSLLQRNNYTGVGSVHVVFRNKLSSGTYFVKATRLDGASPDTFSAPFIVTGGN